jgi:UrcA family protein
MKPMMLMAVIAFVASTATAEAETAQMRVKIGDLDLKTETGAQQALKRIKTAAREFCEVPLELPLTRGFERCHRDLVAKAVSQLDAPMVTALANPPKAVQVATH